MTRRRIAKLVREGEFAAEVQVELIEAGEAGWPPYLSVDDAYRLDAVRDALRRGDIRTASTLSEHVYRLTPVEM